MMSFPDSCGSWAEDDGCTRIVWDAKGCVRYETVDHNYNTVFNVNAFKMNEQLKICLYEDNATLQYPEQGFGDMNEYISFIHVTYSTSVFGLLDDMFL